MTDEVSKLSLICYTITTHAVSGNMCSWALQHDDGMCGYSEFADLEW